MSIFHSVLQWPVSYYLPLILNVMNIFFIVMYLIERMYHIVYSSAYFFANFYK